MSNPKTPLETNSSVNVINTTSENEIKRTHLTTEKNTTKTSKTQTLYNENIETENNSQDNNEIIQIPNNKNNEQNFTYDENFIRDDFKNLAPELNINELAIKCWNCQNINIAKNYWNVFKCPICNEINKIPKPLSKLDEILNYLRATQPITYADNKKTIPILSYLVVCPFCKTDNKVRECACFCICYKCRNKWTIKRPDDNDINNIDNNNNNENIENNVRKVNNEGNYYRFDTKRKIVYPPNKTLRYSDMFFPDPMFYPGYYPINSLSPLYPEYLNPYDDEIYKLRLTRLLGYNNGDIEKRMLNQNNNDNNMISNYNSGNNSGNNSIKVSNYNSGNNSINENNWNNSGNNSKNISKFNSRRNSNNGSNSQFNLKVNKSSSNISKTNSKINQINPNNNLVNIERYDLLRELEKLDKKTQRMIENRYIPEGGINIKRETPYDLNYSFSFNPRKINNDKLKSYENTFFMKNN